MDVRGHRNRASRRGSCDPKARGPEDVVNRLGGVHTDQRSERRARLDSDELGTC